MLAGAFHALFSPAIEAALAEEKGRVTGPFGAAGKRRRRPARAASRTEEEKCPQPWCSRRGARRPLAYGRGTADSAHLRLERDRRNAGRDRETGSWDLPCAQVLRRSERLYSLQSFHPTTRLCKPGARQPSRRGPGIVTLSHFRDDCERRWRRLPRQGIDGGLDSMGAPEPEPHPLPVPAAAQRRTRVVRNTSVSKPAAILTAPTMASTTESAV